jgi:hypothetical protein
MNAITVIMYTQKTNVQIVPGDTKKNLRLYQMSNAIAPLALLGSIASSVGGIAYGVSTEWEFLGLKKKEVAEVVVPTVSQASAFDEGDLSVSDGDFITGVSDDEEIYSGIAEEAAVTDGLYGTSENLAAVPDGTTLDRLAGTPITCSETEDGMTTGLQGFMLRGDKYHYGCASLDEPGAAALGKYGKKGSSDQGTVAGLSGKSAICGPKQAMTSFVLHPNRSGSKVQYKYDCINLRGPTKVRTATTKYSSYDEDADLNSLANASLDVKCNNDELLQAFGLEKSGNNIRYIYRCVTPGYEED